MNLAEYRNIFMVGGLILILAASSPALNLYLPFSGGAESFSEFWVLGPGYMAEDYPFNVKANESYLVYVGVGNHMGVSAYYVVYVKFRNQSDALPNATTGTPSPLPPLYEYRVFLEDGGVWEDPLTFSFSSVSFSEDQALVKNFRVDDEVFSVNKAASWDVENEGYYFQVFLELWIYNAQFDAFQYHNRFVGLWLNMTAS